MKLNLKELVVFGMLGGVMYASKWLMEVFPNIHLLAMLTIAMTLVFRKKALYPIYVYVVMCGVFSGFAPWWVPHLYLWAILWGAAMLIPQTMKQGIKTVVCIGLCAAHGFLYGVMYAPAQALLYGLNFEGMIAWIVTGIPFDLLHGVGNFLAGFLIVPVVRALNLAKKIL
ncbi:MAG: hypothetical protein IKM39_03820 [Clostridia bacterium]|nr:hypothetical protein [Clostridia bacterium]